MARLLIGCALGLILGCSDMSAQVPAPDAAADAALDAPPPAKAPDLRFQWVGAFAAYQQHEITNFAPSVSLTHHDQSSWGPMQMATQVPNSAGWELMGFTPRVQIEVLDSIATGADVSTLEHDVAQLSLQNHVVTSLDIASGSYGVVATAPAAGTATYAPSTTFSAARGNIPQRIADEARRGHVVTALAQNGSLVFAIAYGREGDTTSYETEVVDATFSTLPEAASTLASKGYVITGFGRNGDGALLLVGTRPAGVITPRRIATQTTGPELKDGGAVVAWVLDSTPTGPGPELFRELVVLEY
jgi:hypothetical protein